MRHLLMLIATVLLLGFAAGCGDDDDGGASGGTDTTAADTQSDSDSDTSDAGECTEVPQPSPRKDGGEEKPTEELTGDYAITFDTNCGSFAVDVDESAGLTAASFVALAKSGFYKDTIFHRIAPGFVIQGGDPTGTGTGGPGYTTVDPPPDDASYPMYTVAMAKGGSEPAGTSGSQFFVMTGDSGLPPEYAIVGQVTEGKDVVDAIGALGNAQEVPTRIVKIEKATVSSR